MDSPRALSLLALSLLLWQALPNACRWLDLDAAADAYVSAHWRTPLACILLLCAASLARMDRPWKPTPTVTAEQLADACLDKPTRSAGTMTGPAALYLDLMRRILVNLPYMESSVQIAVMDPSHNLKPSNSFALTPRLEGWDFSTNCLTMTGWRRITHLQSCVETVLARGVCGDFIELGSFKGGSAIFLRACLEALDPCRVQSEDTSEGQRQSCEVGVPAPRRMFVADVFHEEPHDFKPFSPWRTVAMLAALHVAKALAYIPISAWQRWYARALMPVLGFVHDPDVGQDTLNFILNSLRCADNMAMLQHYIPGVRGGYENVRSHFARFGLLDERVVFLKGWFAEAVPTADFEHLSLLRVDGDLYASTRDALETCYPALSTGGVVIIDDYHSFADCARAVDEYRAKHRITAPLEQVDAMCSMWTKAPGELVLKGPQRVSKSA